MSCASNDVLLGCSACDDAPGDLSDSVDDLVERFNQPLIRLAAAVDGVFAALGRVGGVTRFHPCACSASAAFLASCAAAARACRHSVMRDPNREIAEPTLLFVVVAMVAVESVVSCDVVGSTWVPEVSDGLVPCDGSCGFSSCWTSSD